MIPARGARVLERVAEELRVVDRRSVVGERDGAGRRELDEIRELLALPPARDRRDREHARGLRRRAARDELGDEARRVDGRLGVRHRADRGEPAGQCRARTGGDRLRFLEARLAQMCVQVDEAGCRDEAASLGVALEVTEHGHSFCSGVPANR
jgi:hypothetical protein